MLILQFCVQCRFPESSLFLYKKSKDLHAAEKSIEFYVGKAETKSWIDQMTNGSGTAPGAAPGPGAAAAAPPSINLLGALKIKSLRIPLLLALAVGTAKACSGFQVLRSYSTHMFQEAGLHEFLSRFASVILLAEATFGALAACYLTERWGRRVLLLSSIWSICVLFLLAMLFSMIEERFEADYLSNLVALNQINGTGGTLAAGLNGINGSLAAGLNGTWVAGLNGTWAVGLNGTWAAGLNGINGSLAVGLNGSWAAGLNGMNGTWAVGNLTSEAVHMPKEMQWPSFMIAALLWIWPIFNSIGIGSLGHFVIVEVFPSDYRPMGQALTVQTIYIIGMIITFFYLPLQLAIGSYTYLVLFIAPLAVAGVVLQIYFPETKEKCMNVVNPNRNDSGPQLLLVNYTKSERF